MKILGTIKEVDELIELKKRVDGVVLRHQDFSIRYDSTFSVLEMKQIIKDALKYRMSVYIDVTKIFNDDQLSYVYNFICEFLEFNIFYIFGDIGLYQKILDLNITKKLIYAPDTYVCNYLDFNFFKKYKINGVFPSLEIPISDIEVIGNNKKLKMYYKGFGKAPMFYSQRPLVSLYCDNFNLDKNILDKDLTLIEETRQEEYLIVENNSGTNIFQTGIHNVLPVLDTICDVVDFMLLDGIYLEKEKYFKAIDVYKEALCDLDHLNFYNKKLEEIFSNLSYNFIYEDSIYKKGEF